MIKIDFEFNEKFSEAIDFLENSLKNVFITGRAGTGKSTLLKYFRDTTKKNIAVLAPTGVAAINIFGQTIHSFFRFKPDITPETAGTIRVARARRSLYENLDAIVIDEISMVRADLLDCIDSFLRRYGQYKDLPFGGVQMIFFGDLYQLPPVVSRHERELFKTMYESPYFFRANAYSYLKLKVVELTKIYRQKQEDFIRLLGAVRNKSVTPRDLVMLNKRYIPSFQPARDDFYIYLTTTNALADGINQKQLDLLDTASYFFDGELVGDFQKKNLPTHESLTLKIGAQVMLLNNDNQKRWVNGSVGKVISFDEQKLVVNVELSTGSMVEVTPFTWEIFQFVFNEETGQLESEPIGAFTQYPLRLAWAVTIHKIQGKTFSKAIIDIGYGTFAHGQIYVALSRCTNFEGLVLKKPILQKHILIDRDVLEYMAKYEADESCVKESV